MPKLNITVHVADEHGQTHIFGPGEEPPAWARKKITNPAVWADDDERQEQSEPAATGGGSGPMPPPRTGAGSGTAAWADYAARNNVQVRESAGREEIIEALQAAGVPVDRPEE